jgi:hypothetical protein
MKTQLMDSSTKRISVAVGILAAVILVGAALYMVFSAVPLLPINGEKIIAASSSYTHALRQRNLPIPASVSLQTLADQGFLKPSDISVFHGMDARITLVATGPGPTPLMRVKMGDGIEFILFSDGTTQQGTPPKPAPPRGT